MPRFELLAMRHGEAEAYAADGGDAARMLTEHGHRQADAVGRALLALSLQPTAAVSSPYRRARQTLHGVLDACAVAIADPPRLDALVPEAPPRAALDALVRCARSPAEPVRLLAVWHNPSVTAVLGSILAGDSRPVVSFATGDLAHVMIDATGPTLRATLLALWPSRSLAKLTRTLTKTAPRA